MILAVATTAVPASAAPASSTSTTSRKLAAAANGNAADEVDVSADGRYVAFATSATNLHPKDSTATYDVYRYDRLTGALVLVSVDAGGVNAANGDSATPSISSDGRYVAFSSYATNLVAGFTDTNGPGSADVYRRDLQSGTTILLSHVPLNGTAGANGHSDSPDISSGGRYIAYNSWATSGSLRLTFVDNNGGNGDVWRYDTKLATNTLVSEAHGQANHGGNGWSTAPSISADGRYVAFQSAATNLVSGFTDNNGFDGDIFRRDASNGTTVLVSSPPASPSAGGDDESREPSVSGNGRYVAFATQATNLVPGAPDDGTFFDVVVHDLTSGSRELVNIPKGGPNVADNGQSYSPAISDDGSTVVFLSSSTNLISGFVPHSLTHVFVRRNGVTRLVDHKVGAPFHAADGDAQFPVVSGAGKVVAFHTAAGNAASDDSPGFSDVVVKAIDATGAIFVERRGVTREHGQVRSIANFSATSDVVDLEATPSGRGVLALTKSGKVHRYGDAPSFAPFTIGSSPAVAIEMTPTGRGYWMITANGRIATRGDAKALTHLPTNIPDPIAAVESTPTGKGLWLVDTKGRIYERGDATAFPNLTTLSKSPIVAFETTPNGGGYVMINAAGKIYRKGNMPVFDPISPAPTSPVVGLEATPSGKGFVAVCADGRIIRRGDAPALAKVSPVKPLVDLVLV